MWHNFDTADGESFNFGVDADSLITVHVEGTAVVRQQVPFPSPLGHTEGAAVAAAAVGPQ